MLHRSLPIVTLIVGMTAGISAQTPLRLAYQFDELRGGTVANAAMPSTFPDHGTLPNSNWQRDPGRPRFSGNDVGFGCLSQSAVASTNVVDVGVPFTHTGSVTVMWWARRDPSSTAASPFGYFFGDGSFRCFMGSAGILLGNHGVFTSTYTANFTGHLTPGVWNHYTVVIDDAVGLATIHENGIPHATPRAFPAGTYVYNGTSNLAVASNGVTSSSRATVHYDMDDFRIYAGALTTAQILAAMTGEDASATTSGSGCSGPVTTPVIGSTGGAPSLGNLGFTVVANSLEVGRPQVINFGLFPGTAGLPFDLSTVLGATYAGCDVECFPDAFSVVLGGSASGSLGLPIPSIPTLAGRHLYAQTLVLGSQGAASPLLDINLQS